MARLSNHKTQTRVGFYADKNSAKAIVWAEKIRRWIRKRYPSFVITNTRPNFLLVFGGDGTILDAAKKFQRVSPIIVGLNLGRVGFLASVREPKDFTRQLRLLFQGKFRTMERMMLDAEILRRNRVVFKTSVLNDIVVQNILGMVEMKVGIKGCPVQYIHGTGVLVSTATGSTAYNLSTHGPIIMPNIKCFIISELLDHSLPTPSMVIKYNEEVRLRILNFRRHGTLSLTKTGERIDVVLVADGHDVFPIAKGDIVRIRQSPRSIAFAELRKNYFFKSLQEKFAFK